MLTESGFEQRFTSDDAFPFALHYDTLSDHYTVSTHWHEEIEILYSMEGNGYAYFNNEKDTFSKGKVMFVNSYCFHALDRISEDTPCSYYCFFADKSIFTKEVLELNEFQQYAFIDSPDLCRVLDRIIQEEQNQNEFYQQTERCLLNLAMLYIAREGKKNFSNHRISANAKSVEKIRQAIFYINKNLTKQISLQEICSRIQLSPTRFSTLFKAYTGQTFVDYINITRCEFAKNLYQTTDYSVSKCAELSGFNNLSYFARTYKRIYGCTLSSCDKDNL